MNRRLIHSIDRALADSQAAIALSVGILGDLSDFVERRWRF
ncbi:MAG: hypothetical protein ACYCUV_14000 [Phycisphaerae bacterium]